MNMDVALTLAHLFPGAEYSGSVARNTRAEYDALDWLDARKKPSWAALVAAGDAAWAAYGAVQPKTEVEELADMLRVKGVLNDAEISTLKTKRGA